MNTSRQLRPLLPHQIPAMEYAISVRNPALFMDPRLGKTLIAIRKALSVNARRVLVVAPLSALYGWERELRLERQGIPIVLTGTKQSRIYRLHAGIESDARWFLINKEGHRVIGDLLKSTSWDCVILDESPFIKSPYNRKKGCATSRFFCENFRRVPTKIILTGTPAPESELEYFNQLWFLDPKILGYRSYWSFRYNCFAEPVDDPLSGRLYIKLNARAWLSRRLARYCFFQKRKDLNLGGKKIYKKVYVSLPKDAMKTYETANDQFLLEVADKVVASTICAATKFIWLRRIAGGILDGRVLHRAKLTTLADMITLELRGEQVIVWAAFIDEINAIVKRLRVVEDLSVEMIYGDISPQGREDVRRRFVNGSVRVLVIQPECMKHGTDLGVADTMIYYSTPLGLETREQTEDRFIRVDETGSKYIIDLVAEDTIDDVVVDNLMDKTDKIESLRKMIEHVKKTSART